jgi:cytochrome c556
MTESSQSFARPRRRTLIAAACVMLAGLAGSVAQGQDQSAATPADAIIARKTVMDTLSSKMDVLEAATAATAKIDLAGANDQADTVSVLLMAFPHLFPPATNQWKPNVDKDPGTDTFAAPEVWTKFGDFYSQAAAAAKIAYDASRATEEASLRAAVAKLRAACDGCHATYMKTN